MIHTAELQQGLPLCVYKTHTHRDRSEAKKTWRVITSSILHWRNSMARIDSETFRNALTRKKRCAQLWCAQHINWTRVVVFDEHSPVMTTTTTDHKARVSSVLTDKGWKVCWPCRVLPSGKSVWISWLLSWDRQAYRRRDTRLMLYHFPSCMQPV